jgi:hypothetical protein
LLAYWNYFLVDRRISSGMVGIPVYYMINTIRLAIVRWMMKDEYVRRFLKRCVLTNIEEKEWKK